MAIQIFCNLESRQKEPYAAGNAAVLSLPTSALVLQSCLKRLQTATRHLHTATLMSHAMETCELDSPVCKLSRAVMLLGAEAACTVPHCPSTAVGQSVISQAAVSENNIEGALQKYNFF